MSKLPMNKLPFPLQANPPPSSHLPSMADYRLRPIPGHPSDPFSHTHAHAHANAHASTSYHVQPHPLTLPPISQLGHGPPPAVNYPPTNLSHRYLAPPPNPAPQLGSNLQTHPFHVPGTGGFPAMGSTPNGTLPAHPWIDSHLKDLEVIARNDSGEEKGKAFLGVWLGIREEGLRDRQGVRLFIAKILMPYRWFKGDETVGEALRALNRLEFISAGLLAKKHTENANWFWERKIGEITVRDYWMEEGRKQQRQKAQTQANAQGQGPSQIQAQH